MFLSKNLFVSDPNARLKTVSMQGEESATDDTPLTLAVSHYLPYTIRYLVERRCANIDLPNALDLRPIDIAMRICDINADETHLEQKIVEYLQQGEPALAVMKSPQPRLGHASLLQHLFPDTLQHISDLTRPH